MAFSACITTDNVDGKKRGKWERVPVVRMHVVEVTNHCNHSESNR